MTPSRFILLAALGLSILRPVFAAGQKEQAAGERRQKAVRQVESKAGKKAAQQNNPSAQNQPGVQALEKLSKLTPEERQQALAGLPPARRQEILAKIRQFQNLPPTARERVGPQLERLQSLPPQRQAQVRRSLQQFRALPDERKATIRRELNRLSAMPDEDRRSRMNSEEFRNRYSPAEQQMIGNLSVVVGPND